MENIKKYNEFDVMNEYKKEKTLSTTEMKEYIEKNIKNVKDTVQINLIYKIVSTNQPYNKKEE
jgi:hypothetical protein